MWESERSCRNVFNMGRVEPAEKKALEREQDGETRRGWFCGLPKGIILFHGTSHRLVREKLAAVDRSWYSGAYASKD